TAHRYAHPLRYESGPTQPAARRAASRSRPPRDGPATAPAPIPGCRCAAASWLALQHESIADTPDRQEVLRVRRVALEALAQSQDEVVHRPGRGKHIVTPDPLEQILARDDLARMLREHLQDHGFLFRQLLSDPVPRASAKGSEVDFVSG